MSGIAICTDSSSLFPSGVAERLCVAVVPIAITLDGAPFDERERGLDDFYARLAGGAKATTSQPSPGAFLEAYASAAERGATEVISIHLDARVSGAIASAELAALEAPIPVTVVDAATVSYGVGACVRAAAETVAAGASTRDAVDAVRGLSSKLRNAFVAPGGQKGRVGDVGGWALLEFEDGKTRPLAGCDSVEEAVELMAGRIGDASGPVRVAVGHTGTVVESAADALAVSLKQSHQVVGVERYRVGPAVGAHTGPLSFGAFWWPSD